MGEAATIPQLEARLDVSGKTQSGMGWGTYLVGHYDQKDLTGVGVGAPATGDETLTGTALEVGARAVPGPLTLQGNFYWGKAIGQQFGAITQFGDITGWGAWGQAGYTMDNGWSVWGFYGMADPNDDDVVASGNARLKNQIINGMLRYSLANYALGLEWMHSTTTYWTAVDPSLDRNANQLSLSVFYSF